MMRKNEHPRCGCRMCRIGAASSSGKSVHRAVNRKIRHETKIGLARDGADFSPVTVSTPYTD